MGLRQVCVWGGGGGEGGGGGGGGGAGRIQRTIPEKDTAHCT